MRWSASFARSRLPNERKNASAIRNRSRQKYVTTATSVPMWSATSKESPNRSWSSPRKYWPSRRCPELDTGRNSVSPCTIPSTIACRSSSTRQVLRLRELARILLQKHAGLSARRPRRAPRRAPLSPAEGGQGPPVLEGDAPGLHLYEAAAAHLVEDLGHGLAGGSHHGGEVLVGKAEVNGDDAVAAVTELLGGKRQEGGEAHLRLAGKQALDEFLVLNEAQLQERHDLERHAGLLADGPLDEDLGHLRDYAVRYGLGVRPLAGLTGEGQVPEYVPVPEQPERRFLAAGVGPEELHHPRDEHVEGVPVLALPVDGVPGRVVPVRRGYAHLLQETQERPALLLLEPRVLRQ